MLDAVSGHCLGTLPAVTDGGVMKQVAGDGLSETHNQIYDLLVASLLKIVSDRALPTRPTASRVPRREFRPLGSLHRGRLQ